MVIYNNEKNWEQVLCSKFSIVKDCLSQLPSNSAPQPLKVTL